MASHATPARTSPPRDTGSIANIIGPPSFVTAQNLQRVIDPSLVSAEGFSGPDAEYITPLGADGLNEATGDRRAKRMAVVEPVEGPGLPGLDARGF